MLVCCGCGSPNIENKDLGLCASCNRDRRKVPKVKVVHPVKKVTEKRAKQNREYLKMREDFLIQYPVCQIAGCNKPAVEVHHRAGRANDLLTNPENFLAICSDCHSKITEHSREAINEGYSELRSK